MKKWIRDNDDLWHIVLLHGKYDPSRSDIADLTDEEAEAVEKYCIKAHLRAGDNIVRVPAEPVAMKAWKRFDMSGGTVLG